LAGAVDLRGYQSLVDSAPLRRRARPWSSILRYGSGAGGALHVLGVAVGAAACRFQPKALGRPGLDPMARDNGLANEGRWQSRHARCLGTPEEPLRPAPRRRRPQPRSPYANSRPTTILPPDCCLTVAPVAVPILAHTSRTCFPKAGRGRKFILRSCLRYRHEIPIQ
jgi:hypothetical protein